MGYLWRYPLPQPNRKTLTALLNKKELRCIVMQLEFPPSPLSYSSSVSVSSAFSLLNAVYSFYTVTLSVSSAHATVALRKSMRGNTATLSSCTSPIHYQAGLGSSSKVRSVAYATYGRKRFLVSHVECATGATGVISRRTQLRASILLITLVSGSIGKAVAFECKVTQAKSSSFSSFFIVTFLRASAESTSGAVGHLRRRAYLSSEVSVASQAHGVPKWLTRFSGLSQSRCFALSSYLTIRGLEGSALVTPGATATITLLYALEAHLITRVSTRAVISIRQKATTAVRVVSQMCIKVNLTSIMETKVSVRSPIKRGTK